MQSGGRQTAEAPHQPVRIYRTYLIQDDEARAAPEPARNPERVWVAARSQRSDYHSRQVGVQLVRRDDEAWTRLPDLAAQGRIERDQVDVTAIDRHPSFLVSCPLPLGLVEPGWSRSIQEAVLTPLAHANRRVFPGGPGARGGRDQDSVRSEAELHVVLEARFLQNGLRDAHASRLPLVRQVNRRTGRRHDDGREPSGE